jgi:hypothetical protein
MAKLELALRAASCALGNNMPVAKVVRTSWPAAW